MRANLPKLGSIRSSRARMTKETTDDSGIIAQLSKSDKMRNMTSITGRRCLLALTPPHGSIRYFRDGLSLTQAQRTLEAHHMAETNTVVRTKTNGRRRTWGEVRVFGHWCKGCGLCIAFCPTGVFAAGDGGHPRVGFPERCTACLWCELHCPDMAIDVIRHSQESDAG
jgi:NAD-dependent dihydropyrimidine dehydrogenase PreA subunit